jgi:hypothetical protein
VVLDFVKQTVLAETLALLRNPESASKNDLDRLELVLFRQRSHHR